MRRWALAAILAIVACSDERKPAEPTSPPAVATSLGGTMVARIGDVPIDRALVLAVARARKLSADEALQAVIDEALLARAAEQQGGPNDPEVRVRSASTLSRALLEQLRERAIASGPFSDEELEGPVKAHWLELDRPEVRVLVHALVKKDVPGGAAVGRALRDELLTANGPNADKSRAAFVERAKSFKVPSGPAVHVEDIEIAADGRLADAGVEGKVLDSFTKGAFAIPELFGTSEVVETDYGFHVIRLLARKPEHRASREEKIRVVMPELVAARVRPLHGELLGTLHAQTKIEIVARDSDLTLPK